MSRPARELGLLGALLLLAGPAGAHSRSESFSRWEVDGFSVRMTFTVLEREATRIPWEEGETPDLTAHLARHLRGRIGVGVDGRSCAGAGGLRPLRSSRGFLRIEGIWRCPEGETLEIREQAFVDLVPSHVHFARVRTGKDAPSEHLFTDRRRAWSISLHPAGEGAGTGPEQGGSSILDFVVLGIRHILSGLDHVAFLIGLVLMCRSLKDIGFVVTGFTLGHSLTLAVAVLGRLQPDEKVIEASIGLTIAIVAAENVAVAAGRIRTVALAFLLILGGMTAFAVGGGGNIGSPVLGGLALFAFCYLLLIDEAAASVRLRAALTSLFGLVHGLGFATALIHADLPTGRLVVGLFGFNLGVEIGQLLLVCALVAVGGILARVRIGPPREILRDFASAALCGLGLYWFVGRAYL